MQYDKRSIRNDFRFYICLLFNKGGKRGGGAWEREGNGGVGRGDRRGKGEGKEELLRLETVWRRIFASQVT